jgi:hypothetical protein
VLDRQFACSLHLGQLIRQGWGIGGVGTAVQEGYLCLELWLLLSYLVDWNWKAGLHIIAR